MAKSKCIGGLTIFSVCCTLYAKTAFFAPTDEELRNPLVARRSEMIGGTSDPGGLLHSMRNYVLLVGVIGLFVSLEDYYIERSKAKKPNKAPEPTVRAVTSPAAQEPRQP